MKAVLFSWVLLLPMVVASQSPDRAARFNLSKEHVALSEYDPVSYFNGKPLEGSASLSYEHQGVKYFFVNDENRQRFIKEPLKYEPQYGGWCAYAMGNTGEKVEVDAETFKIIDGKLYLFYNKFFNNTLTSWNKNEAVLKSQADKNWEKLSAK